MLDKLYITPRQWLHILRWTLYCLLFLGAMMLQDVVLGDVPVFGTKPDFMTVVIVCVCLREGPERGGLFALSASLFRYLSGADYGSVGIAVLTFFSVCGSLLCASVLSNRFTPCLFLTALTLFSLHTIVFLLKYLLDGLVPALFTEKLLPCVLISLLSQPIVYPLVKTIHRIGDDYEST